MTLSPDLKALCERLRSNWAHNDHRDAATALEALAADKDKARTLAATLAAALAQADGLLMAGDRDTEAFQVIRAALVAAREQGVIE